MQGQWEALTSDHSGNSQESCCEPEGNVSSAHVVNQYFSLSASTCCFACLPVVPCPSFSLWPNATHSRKSPTIIHAKHLASAAELGPQWQDLRPAQTTKRSDCWLWTECCRCACPLYNALQSLLHCTDIHAPYSLKRGSCLQTGQTAAAGGGSRQQHSWLTPWEPPLRSPLTARLDA